MANKVAFFAVVYPGVEKFLTDFFGSLNAQTYKNFDVVLVNDRLDGIEAIIGHYPSLNVVTIKYHGTPAQNRAQGFQFLGRAGYDYIILGDGDDFYSANRIEQALAWLSRFDIVVNDFDLVNKEAVLMNKGYLSQRLAHKTPIDFDFLRNKNIFGFGNTAIKGTLLKYCRFEADSIAVDWFLFSCLLKEGYSAVFVNDAVTYHRIYDENTLSLDQITPALFKRGLEIKMNHYTQMALVDSSFVAMKNRCALLYEHLQQSGKWESHLKEVKEVMPRPVLWLEEI